MDSQQPDQPQNTQEDQDRMVQAPEQPSYSDQPLGDPIQDPQTDEPAVPVELAPDQAFDFTQDTTSKIDLSQPISWQATEGVQASKNTTWYVIFGLVVIGLMALAVLVFKSWTFAVLLAVMTVAVIVLSSKPPRMINYSISPKGVYVGDKLYDFSEFRAFGVIQDQATNSILLLPVKRFSPGLTIYFGSEEGEAIVDMLGARLPMQEVKPDSLEKFIRMIRL